MIIRENYLLKIRPFYDVDLIKVITGIRRCGKSVILTQIIDEIKNNNKNRKNIIYINFESKEYSFIKNDDDLYSYVKNNIKKNMENDIVLHLTIGEDITKDKRCKNKNLVKLEKVDYYYLKLKKVIEKC